MEEINKKITNAFKALDQNDLQEANRLTLDIEEELLSIVDPLVAAQLRAQLGGLLIDLGNLEANEAQVEKGTKYAADILTLLPMEKHVVQHYYNAANGFSNLWNFRSRKAFKEGRLDDSLEEAKSLYRKAIDLAQSRFISQNRRLYNQLLVNFANCYDSVGRSIEAASEYDRVIRNNPLMGEALGNKGITLFWLAPLAHGYTHIFYLEAHRLLTEAIKQPLHTEMKNSFARYLEQLNAIISKHGGMKPEEIQNSQPLCAFHDFLRQFCAKHNLFLTPATLIGSDQNTMIYGDPLFISKMVAPLHDRNKFDRYITYLNQIKQDYVLARYLLVQSQYQSEFVEAVDDGVTLFYPLDYSLHSTYVQMLKTAFRLAVDVLDKIAFFVRDYYSVKSISSQKVNFRNLFSLETTPLNLRSELAGKNNIFLFALFDLALDLRKNGYYEFVYERRNALTHRVLVVHDMILEESQEDITRVNMHDFLKECIQIMQITRAAVIYLILMVDLEEQRASGKGPHGTISGTPVDGVLRWIPNKP